MVDSVLAVVGPTGSGKSDLGLYLAERLQGEIVNCDSVQVYRGFDIGSAKTPVERRRGIPHHLIDVAAPDEDFTAGEYAKQARAAIAEIAARARLPIVVGGTGFYLRALLEGLFPGPARDNAVRERLSGREQARPGSLHSVLSRLDPASARRIHAHDVSKIIRALEVRLVAQQPLSKMFAEGGDPLGATRVIKVGLNPPREELYERLNRRMAHMAENGLIQEVRALLAAGISSQAKAFASLGYKQALAVERGESTLVEAIASAQQETRRYAKRQMTWFRRERDLKWFAGFGDSPEVQHEVFAFAQRVFAAS